MAEDPHKPPDVELLPLRQRIAWIAVVWLLSTGFLALATWLIRGLLTG